MRYLLDANTVSEPRRPNPAAGILRRLRRHGGEAAIPSPAWHELRFGCARLPRSRRRGAIERHIETVVLASFPILDHDRKAADWHALERARPGADGKTPPFVDGQITAIAHVNGLVLITSNMRDFNDFRDMRVRSWA